MKRKGFLAALLGLAAARVLAKVKPKTVVVWKATCPGPSEVPQYPLGTRHIGPDGYPQIYCKMTAEGVLTTE